MTGEVAKNNCKEEVPVGVEMMFDGIARKSKFSRSLDRVNRKAAEVAAHDASSALKEACEIEEEEISPFLHGVGEEKTNGTAEWEACRQASHILEIVKSRIEDTAVSIEALVQIVPHINETVAIIGELAPLQAGERQTLRTKPKEISKATAEVADAARAVAGLVACICNVLESVIDEVDERAALGDLVRNANRPAASLLSVGVTDPAQQANKRALAAASKDRLRQIYETYVWEVA